MLGKEVAVISKLMDVAAMRHKMHAHNIANINTPGFKHKSVEFENLLEQSRSSESILNVDPKIVEGQNPERIDDNSTYLEQEMSGIIENNLKYQVYLQALSRKIKGIEGAISGRF